MTPMTGTEHGLLDVIKGEGAGRVAGDDEEFRALFFDQELRALTA